MIKNDIKAIITKNGKTMSDVVRALNEKHDRNYSVQNLSNKLAKETIRYKEVLEIADVLDMEIKWIKKE